MVVKCSKQLLAYDVYESLNLLVKPDFNEKARLFSGTFTKLSKIVQLKGEKKTKKRKRRDTSTPTRTGTGRSDESGVDDMVHVLAQTCIDEMIGALGPKFFTVHWSKNLLNLSVL